ncbi:F-box protein SKIP24 [Platanthera zijinensis]|uniref:F-box protein SKIP24 n=1 Tax=Platanthera zijinensis TaxID=2320716 RepID=A0AAP0BZV5_9ASPA
MSFLPDEIWIKILEMGVAAHSLSCRDLCSLSITSRRHNRLSGDPSLWFTLVTLDFSQEPRKNSSPSPASHSKDLYKTMFERSKARRVAARRRAILIAESNVAVCIKRLEELERRWREEGERMKAAVLELNNLERVR